MSKENCKDCGVGPSEAHADGCDVVRCSSCGGQRISCDCQQDGQAEFDDVVDVMLEKDEQSKIGVNNADVDHVRPVVQKLTRILDAYNEQAEQLAAARKDAEALFLKNGVLETELVGRDKEIGRLRGLVKAVTDTFGKSVGECLTLYPDEAKAWLESCPQDDNEDWPDNFPQWLLEQGQKGDHE